VSKLIAGPTQNPGKTAIGLGNETHEKVGILTAVTLKPDMVHQFEQYAAK
jgi:hypothetical protein